MDLIMGFVILCAVSAIVYLIGQIFEELNDKKQKFKDRLIGALGIILMILILMFVVKCSGDSVPSKSNDPMSDWRQFD